MPRLFWISCLLQARPASAARKERAATSPTAPARDAPVDNDVPANEAAPELPLCVLTDAQREQYRARAAALPAPTAGPLPGHVEARSARLLQHVAAAWGVRERLVGVEVDGVAITAAELDDALPLVTWMREVLAHRALPEPEAPDGDGAMASIVTDVGLVCEGLMLRHAGDARMRGVVSSIRRERRPSALGGAVSRLLVLCDDPATAASLAKLPKGEGAAVARLRDALPTWERRVATRAVGEGSSALSPLAVAQRAWAMAQAATARIVRAGRYLAKGDAAQEKQWRAWRPAKKKPKTDAPTPDA